MDMRFFFILKESRDGKRVLLCENPTVFGNNLYGWVDKDEILQLHHRLFIEPNWNSEYNERHKGKQVAIYADSSMTSGNKIASWEFGKSNGDKDRWFQYRMIPSQLRFPVIDKIDEKENQIHCICFADKSSFMGSRSEIQLDPEFLKRYLGIAGYERWKQVKAISAFDGYTRRTDMNGNEYWHYVLFLSGGELQKLLDDLKPAYEVAKKKLDDRKPYVDAMRDLVKAHLGQANDKGIDSIDNLDEDQLRSIIYAIDIHADKDKRLKLKDIADPRVVTSIEYRKLLSNFQQNYEKLMGLYNDGYTYRTKLGKDWYYWIPIEELPFLN